MKNYQRSATLFFGLSLLLLAPLASATETTTTSTAGEAARTAQNANQSGADKYALASSLCTVASVHGTSPGQIAHENPSHQFAKIASRFGSFLKLFGANAAKAD